MHARRRRATAVIHRPLRLRPSPALCRRGPSRHMCFTALLVCPFAVQLRGRALAPSMSTTLEYSPPVKPLLFPSSLLQTTTMTSR